MSGLENVLGNVYKNADDEPRRPSMDDVRDSLDALAEEAESRSRGPRSDPDDTTTSGPDDHGDETPGAEDVTTSAPGPDQDPDDESEPGVNDWMSTAIDALTESEMPEPADLFDHVSDPRTDDGEPRAREPLAAERSTGTGEGPPTWLQSAESADEADWLSALEETHVPSQDTDDDQALQTLGITTTNQPPEPQDGPELSDDEFSELLAETDDTWLDELFEVPGNDHQPHPDPQAPATGDESNQEGAWLDELFEVPENDHQSHPDPQAPATGDESSPSDPTGLGLTRGDSDPELAPADSPPEEATDPPESTTPVPDVISRQPSPEATADEPLRPELAVETLDIPSWTLSDDDIVPAKRSRGRRRRQESEAEVAQLTDDPIELFSPEAEPEPTKRRRRGKKTPTNTDTDTNETKPPKRRRLRGRRKGSEESGETSE